MKLESKRGFLFFEKIGNNINAVHTNDAIVREFFNYYCPDLSDLAIKLIFEISHAEYMEYYPIKDIYIESPKEVKEWLDFYEHSIVKAIFDIKGIKSDEYDINELERKEL